MSPDLCPDVPDSCHVHLRDADQRLETEDPRVIATNLQLGNFNQAPNKIDNRQIIQASTDVEDIVDIRWVDLVNLGTGDIDIIGASVEQLCIAFHPALDYM
jgi:hypothetical protein